MYACWLANNQGGERLVLMAAPHHTSQSVNQAGLQLSSDSSQTRSAGGLHLLTAARSQLSGSGVPGLATEPTVPRQEEDRHPPE